MINNMCLMIFIIYQFLTDYLDKLGLSVERQYVTDTGFRATYGSGKHSDTPYAIYTENSRWLQ